MSLGPVAQPPRIAAWLVDLFITDAQTGIRSDLLEGFFAIKSKCGMRPARRWYWRQSATAVVGLIGTAFRTAPWLIVGTVFGGFLLLEFSTSRLQRAIVVVFDLHNRYVVSHYDSKGVATYFFWLKTGVLIGSLLESLIIGSLVAVVAKGREMVAAMTLSFVSLVMTATIFWVSVARHEPVDPDLFPAIMIQQLTWSCMIAIGGVIVRKIRSAPNS